MKKLISSLALVLAILFSFSACNLVDVKDTENLNFADIGVNYVKASDLTKNPKAAVNRKDTVIIGASEFGGIWNYLLTDTASDIYASYLMFDFNIEIGFDGQAAEGATTYKVSDDGLTYTFTLKDNVKFWNGDKATAQDLEFAYYVCADPKYDGPYDISSADIKGLSDYKEGTAERISGIKVVNESTLEVTLNSKNAAALYKLQMPIMSKKYYAPDFKKGDIDTVKAKNNAPMGTGQYKFVSYKTDELLTLEANDNYYKGKPNIKNVIISITPAGEELQRIKAGETDIELAKVSTDNVNFAKETGFIDIYRFPTNGFGYIALNEKLEKFKDIKVRKALLYAINRSQIVENIYGPYAKVVNIPQSSVSWSYTDEDMEKYEYNIKKAEQLLDEAGWKLNKDGKREKDGKLLTIKFTTSDAQSSVNDVLIPAMKDTFTKLGIDLTTENLEFSVLYEKFTAGELEANLMTFGLTPDPAEINTAFMTDGSQNNVKYSNSEVDRLLDEGFKELDIQKRKTIYKNLYKILNDELPILPVYQRYDMWVANGRIKGIELSSYRELFFNLYKCKISE